MIAARVQEHDYDRAIASSREIKRSFSEEEKENTIGINAPR